MGLAKRALLQWRIVMDKPKSSVECPSLDGWRGEGKIGIVSRVKGLVVNTVGSTIERFRKPQVSASFTPAHPASSWAPQSVPRMQCATDERVAREIMGRNFLGLDAALTKFGIVMTEEELLNYPEIPWSEDELEQCKNTHLLVAGYPLSILDVRAKAPRNPKTFYRYEDGWYNNQRFATEERVSPRWYFIRKTPVDHSASKTWNEQQKLILSHEEVPRACELVYAIVLYYLVTGERLFPSIYVRTADIDSDGDRVSVGYFGADGLYVSSHWDDSRYISIGLLSARKSNC